LLLGEAGSMTAIVGAYLGLALPTRIVQGALGIAVLLIALLMWKTRNSVADAPPAVDRWAAALGLRGTFHDPATGRDVPWAAHRMRGGLIAFAGIGLIGGLFGLGAGWANVPALNILMGVPLKLAVGTSGLAISIINSSAAWVYLNEGALLPMLHVPSILGVMVGARVGVKMLRRMQASTARRIVIAILVVAGIRSLSQGLGF
jgi:uncharacterized membrane protein YfcA